MLTKLKTNIDRVQARNIARNQVGVEVSPQVWDQVWDQVYLELSERVGILARNPVALKLLRAIKSYQRRRFRCLLN